jgi:hypothetical protein
VRIAVGRALQADRRAHVDGYTLPRTIAGDKNLNQRQIEATDAQIDALVYEFYGLTEEEIAIVEEAT